MNEINRETDRQFRALAPAEIVRGGKTYRREAALFDDAANRADFDLRRHAKASGKSLSYFDEEAKEHRRFVYEALLHGGLNFVLPEYPTISEKLRHLKLDYILVERIGPYEDNITSQLSGYLREVYRDDRCVLWQLVIP